MDDTPVVEPKPVNNEVELGEDKLFSDKMKNSEARGLTHWMLYTEG